jgi:hypothetical protein
MKPRTRRRLISLAVAAVGFVYFQGATRLGERAIAAQQPQAAAEPAAAHYINRTQLMQDVSTLASAEFAGRRTGSPGGLKARAWIAEQFGKIGLQPAGDAGFLQPFQFTHRSVRGLILPERPFTTEYPDAANVIGRVDGTVAGAPAIVLSAHYDHLGTREGATFYGADDNASGVTTVLAAARYFKANPPRHPMVFAAFDAEELGLKGAEAFVESRKGRLTMALDVNLDMVSRNDRNEIFAAGPYHYPQFSPWLRDLQPRSAVKILLGHDRPMFLAGGIEDWTHSSDHGIFHRAGIPFVYFGVEDHPDYHEPTDTADKIDVRFFGAAADMIVDALRTFDTRLP